jgi:hypothetical protein
VLYIDISFSRCTNRYHLETSPGSHSLVHKSVSCFQTGIVWQMKGSQLCAILSLRPRTRMLSRGTSQSRCLGDQHPRGKECHLSSSRSERLHLCRTLHQMYCMPIERSWHLLESLVEDFHGLHVLHLLLSRYSLIIQDQTENQVHIRIRSIASRDERCTSLTIELII